MSATNSTGREYHLLFMRSPPPPPNDSGGHRSPPDKLLHDAAAREHGDRSAGKIWKRLPGLDPQMPINGRQQVLRRHRIVDGEFRFRVRLADDFAHSQPAPRDQGAKSLRPVVAAQAD